MDTPNTQMHDCSLSWLDTDTSIKRERKKSKNKQTNNTNTSYHESGV